MTSFRVVSEMAIEPESECRTPTLIGSAHSAEAMAVEARRLAMAKAGRRMKGISPFVAAVRPRGVNDLVLGRWSAKQTPQQ